MSHPILLNGAKNQPVAALVKESDGWWIYRIKTTEPIFTFCFTNKITALMAWDIARHAEKVNMEQIAGVAMGIHSAQNDDADSALRRALNIAGLTPDEDG